MNTTYQSGNVESVKVIEYIKNSLRTHHSKDEIRNSLVNVGWNKGLIDNILKRF